MRRIRLLRTSAFRMTLLFAAVFALCVAVLFGVIEWYATASIEEGLRSTVSARIAGLVGAEPIMTPHLIGAAAASEERSNGAYILLENWSGMRLAGNLPEVPAYAGWMTLRVTSGARTDVPVVARGVRLLDGGYLLVGQDASRIEEFQELIARAFAIGGFVTLLLAVIAGFLFSRRVLRRLAAVGRASQEIMQGDLSRRLPARGTGDEFDQLIDGFNAMLDRIAVLVDSIRQVSNDIAHDLRTPLARLQHRLEDVRRQPRATEDYERAIDRSIADTAAILETFAALLRIAQIEAETGQDRFADLDAADLVLTAAELYESLAEEKGQTVLARPANARLRGDREQLVQMLGNLVENACRHAPEGARIAIGSASVEDGVLLWVQDDGPGIPEVERDKVFRRFYRLEASRTTPGSGIGLSLAAAVATRHGGRITLQDAAPGLRVEVWLPGVLPLPLPAPPRGGGILKNRYQATMQSGPSPLGRG